MTKPMRILLAAAASILVFISLPLWLPPSAPPAAEIDAQAGALAAPDDLPAAILVDAGWVTGAYNVRNVILPPAILRWQPGQDEADWRVESEQILGSYADGEGRLYYSELKQLNILDADSGTLLSTYRLEGTPTSGLGAVHLVPVGRDGERLYLRNDDALNNLFVFNLAAETFSEESWTLCEQGHQIKTAYLEEQAAFVSLCITYNNEMRSYVTRLSLEDGAMVTLEFAQTGVEDHIAANGFAVESDQRAYVVDSLAGTLAEIDLGTMTISRQASYRLQASQNSPLQGFVQGLLVLAAGTAEAKMPISHPALSPNGRYLAVYDDAFSQASGDRVRVIDLDSLRVVETIQLPQSVLEIYFASDNWLYILLQGQEDGGSQMAVFDMTSRQVGLYALPEHGWIMAILASNQ
jgi:hypothetical protein